MYICCHRVLAEMLVRLQTTYRAEAQQLRKLCSSTGNMVIDDSLYILISLHLSSGGVIPRNSFRIHIDDLPVPLVLEQ